MELNSTGFCPDPIRNEAAFVGSVIARYFQVPARLSSAEELSHEGAVALWLAEQAEAEGPKDEQYYFRAVSNHLYNYFQSIGEVGDRAERRVYPTTNYDEDASYGGDESWEGRDNFLDFMASSNDKFDTCMEDVFERHLHQLVSAEIIDAIQKLARYTLLNNREAKKGIRNFAVFMLRLEGCTHREIADRCFWLSSESASQNSFVVVMRHLREQIDTPLRSAIREAIYSKDCSELLSEFQARIQAAKKAYLEHYPGGIRQCSPAIRAFYNRVLWRTLHRERVREWDRQDYLRNKGERLARRKTPEGRAQHREAQARYQKNSGNSAQQRYYQKHREQILAKRRSPEALAKQRAASARYREKKKKKRQEGAS